MADTSFEKRFRAALNEYINRQNGVDSNRVMGYETDTVTDGYCETCWYERTVVEIYYIETDTGRSRIYTYDGDFGALIREL